MFADVPSRRTFLIVAFLVTLAPVAAAQELLMTPTERAALVRDAFASAYGKALTAEFGKSLRKDADPSCLKGKGSEASELDARGRDLLIKWGTKYLEGIIALYDTKVFADLFTATDELNRLKQNADVKRYLAIYEPERQAKVLDLIFENFERYVLIHRIRLTQVHPLRTGNQELLSKNPIDATEKAVDKFLASKKSAALDRYLDLSDHVQAAVAASTASMTKDQSAKFLRVLDFFKGVEVDLAELCIGTRETYLNPKQP